MKKVFLIFSWALISAGTGLTGVAGYQLARQQVTPHGISPPPLIGLSLTDPDRVMGAQTELIIAETADSRPQALKAFIERHNPSLLEQEPEFYQELVEIADRYGLDYRFLPAIAMKESGMCKTIPENSFNCLGLGVHSQGTWRFESFGENFDTAARVLKKNYIDQGLITPEQIMTKYTPHSPEGAWARGVNQFMNEIKYNDRQKGREAGESNVVTAGAERGT